MITFGMKHINHICCFSLPLDICPWVTLKGQIKVIDSPMGCAL